MRIYDAFVESLSMEDIEINCNKVGNSQYDPKAMLKLLIYGYSYGLPGYNAHKSIPLAMACGNQIRLVTFPFAPDITFTLL